MELSEKKLMIIVPCYNEEDCLPLTAPVFLRKIRELIESGKCAPNSRVLYVDDGSKDATWELIRKECEQEEICGLRLIPNGGHQNAVMAGLMEALAEDVDVTISIDADLQDSIDAMGEMLDAYGSGAEIVYGVRNSRATDSFLKRFTARGFYTVMNLFGAKVVYDHADYRLMSREALRRLSYYHGDTPFLRGLATRLGLPSAKVSYDRLERVAGESKYTLKKMLKLAAKGMALNRVKPQDTPRPRDPRIAEKLWK